MIITSSLLFAAILLLAGQAVLAGGLVSDDFIVEGKMYSIERPSHGQDDGLQGEGKETDKGLKAFTSRGYQLHENKNRLFFEEEKENDSSFCRSRDAEDEKGSNEKKSRVSIVHMASIYC